MQACFIRQRFLAEADGQAPAPDESAELLLQGVHVRLCPRVRCSQPTDTLAVHRQNDGIPSDDSLLYSRHDSFMLVLRPRMVTHTTSLYEAESIKNGVVVG